MQDISQLLAASAQWLSRLGFCPGTAGNLSVRIARDRILVTRTCCSKGMLTAEEIVEVDHAREIAAGNTRCSERAPNAPCDLRSALRCRSGGACPSSNCYRLCVLKMEILGIRGGLSSRTADRTSSTVDATSNSGAARSQTAVSERDYLNTFDLGLRF